VKTKQHPFAVVYRSHVYYLSSKKARRLFKQDPLKYLAQQSPMCCATPFRIGIVGPPKCGKTTLAMRFVKQFGCVRVSAGEAIRYVLDRLNNTQLAVNMQSLLIKGKQVTDEMTVECIEAYMLEADCKVRGYVLDGFPATKNQVKLLTERLLIPVKIIELKCDLKESMHRCIRDRTSAERLARPQLVLHDSPEIIGYRTREWKREIGFVRSWYTNEHDNWIELNGHDSKWLLWTLAKQLGFDTIRHVQVYLQRIRDGKAACIARLCVTREEMLNRMGTFGQYCPVSLALRGELVDCSAARKMDYVAEYQAYYYKMYSNDELQAFLNEPEKFVPPLAPRKLPPSNALPRMLSRTEIDALQSSVTSSKQIEFNGYCAVTYFDGRQLYEALQNGSPEFACEYKTKLYYMADECKLNKFMRKPDVYASLKLPHKLPPAKLNLKMTELPMGGYLEQALADMLEQALVKVGNFKPKFPFLSATRSALLYIAYYLKGKRA
jgi:adenylate/nucleoside-diphosphate kinase